MIQKIKFLEGAKGCGHWEATDALGKGAAMGRGAGARGFGDEWVTR